VRQSPGCEWVRWMRQTVQTSSGVMVHIIPSIYTPPHPTTVPLSFPTCRHTHTPVVSPMRSLCALATDRRLGLPNVGDRGGSAVDACIHRHTHTAVSAGLGVSHLVLVHQLPRPPPTHTYPHCGVTDQPRGPHAQTGVPFDG
jgi:hypothetical protein